MPSLFKVTRGAQGAGAGVHRGPQPGTRGWSSCSTQGGSSGHIFGAVLPLLPRAAPPGSWSRWEHWGQTGA